jgi:hypothetical protein
MEKGKITEFRRTGLSTCLGTGGVAAAARQRGDVTSSW